MTMQVDSIYGIHVSYVLSTIKSLSSDVEGCKNGDQCKKSLSDDTKSMRQSHIKVWFLDWDMRQVTSGVIPRLGWLHYASDFPFPIWQAWCDFMWSSWLLDFAKDFAFLRPFPKFLATHHRYRKNYHLQSIIKGVRLICSPNFIRKWKISLVIPSSNFRFGS
jgi:hypothetical protein